MNPVDQFVLGIALQVHQVMTGLAGAALQVLVDLGQGGSPVFVGFAGAQQVEVGAMQDEQGGHADCSLLEARRHYAG
ncbi:hypothetical protein D9M71_79900 [compost metagenome]